MFARAGDSESFVVEQALDLENGFDVFAAIQAVAAWAFNRLQRGKFGFPIAKDERFGRGDAADFTDAEKTLRRQSVQDGSGSSSHS